MNDLSGLSTKEAEKRLKKFGLNEIKDVNKNSAVKIFLRQIKNNFIIYLLLLVMILSFFVGKSLTAYVILSDILLVIFTGFFQEYKAEKAIEKLKEMVMPISIIIRDGVEQEISTREIVPGDILILRTGEKIPADCVIISEKNLLVNESILTGESNEIEKKSAKDLASPENENLIFAGSFIVDGKCVAKVIYTGMTTKFGKIAGMISSTEKEPPLQKKVNSISKYTSIIGITMALLTGLVFLVQSGFYDSVLVDVLILVIAISVSSFPEGLPVVLTTTLSVGAYRMAQKNAIINRMSVIETLGETTIICSDKTGTITKGEMTAKKIFLDNNFIDVTGVGYEGNGEFLLNGKKVIPSENNLIGLFLKSATLCNDAKIRRTGEDKLFQIFGAPTEAALLVMSSKADFYSEDFNSERIDEIPFSSERKMMSVVCKEDRTKTIYSKGALEFLLKKCSYFQKRDGVFKLLERDREKIIEQNKKMTSLGLRTIAIAYKKLNYDEKKFSENELIFLGIAGIEDAPREGVKKAIELCKEAGIKIKMITGDDKHTAISIAKQIGLGSGKVLDGDEIDLISDEDLIKVVNNTVVFARVKPEHKLRIVKALKNNGEIVTMTGDGVNDSPALKEAHIGVAMGKNGTDVSRSVVDITLKDDNFVTLVYAIKEGRTIFNNIRKFVAYQLSCSYAELFILFLGTLLSPIFLWPIPILLALQILFMNIVTDDFPAITLGLNKSSDDIMDEKPRKNSGILNKQIFIYLILFGTLMALFTLFSFYFSFNILGQNETYARTTALLTLIILEVAGAFVFRSFRKLTLTRSFFANPYLAIASIFSLIATVVIIYTPAKKIFETTALPFSDWAFAFGVGIILIILSDIFKKINSQKKFLDLNC